MGESGVSDKTPTKTITPIEYLDELCAYAMSIGMSYHDYWYGDYEMLKYYIRADEMKRIRHNNELWLQGLYVYQAIGSLVPILNPFSKDHKAKPYLKAPIPITKREMEEIESKNEQKVFNYLMSKVKKTEVNEK